VVVVFVVHKVDDALSPVIDVVACSFAVALGIRQTGKVDQTGKIDQTGGNKI
jgi:hypothetical protein